MSAVEILRQARELIADKSRWTQGTFARRRGGGMVHSKDERAVCWCAKGAIVKAAPDVIARGEAIELLDEVSSKIYSDHVVAINDDGGDPDAAHHRVLAIYDAAIAKAEATNA